MSQTTLNNGLILTNWADEMAKNQDRLVQRQNQQNQQVLFEQQQENLQRENAQRETKNAAMTQYSQGDFEGARQTAASGNAWDVWSSLDAEKKKEAAEQATRLGTAAYTLQRLPSGEARHAYFRTFGKTSGMSPEEIEQYIANGVIDDNSQLQAYADQAVGIKAMWDADQETLKYERDMSKPITGADGAVIQRDVETGLYKPIYLPGQKGEGRFVTDDDGKTYWEEVAATPGTIVGGGGNGGGGAPVEMDAARGTVRDTLAGAGLPAPVVAGFLGNFDVEGGYGSAQGDRGSDRSRRDGGAASGIAQWRGSRRDAFARRYGKQPHEASHAEQAQFVVWELTTPEGRASAGISAANAQKILNARTPAEAAALIDQYYERSDGAHRDRRIAAAQRYAGGGGSQGQSAPQGQRGGGRSVTRTPIGQQSAPSDKYREETRTIGGRQIVGQVALSGKDRGKFTPYPGQTAADKGLTGEQQKVGGFADRIEEAVGEMDEIRKEGYDPSSVSAGIQRYTGGLPVVGGFLSSEQAKRQEQAERNIINAILRRESGAAIGASEFESAEKQYFPRAGDSPAVVAQKRRNLQTVINAYRRESETESRSPQPQRQGQRGGAGSATPGTVRNGYRFRGGNPRDRNNWVKM